MNSYIHIDALSIKYFYIHNDIIHIDIIHCHNMDIIFTFTSMFYEIDILSVVGVGDGVGGDGTE